MTSELVTAKEQRGSHVVAICWSEMQFREINVNRKYSLFSLLRKKTSRQNVILLERNECQIEVKCKHFNDQHRLSQSTTGGIQSSSTTLDGSTDPTESTVSSNSVLLLLTVECVMSPNEWRARRCRHTASQSHEDTLYERDLRRVCVISRECGSLVIHSMMAYFLNRF